MFAANNRRFIARNKIKILDQKQGANWIAYHGDAAEVIRGIPDNSIHYQIFSPPFSNLFCYSASVRDMGNSTDKEFYNHFQYIVPHMFRVCMPGRLLSFHCSDIPAMKERDGYMGLKDFPAYLRELFEDVGFIYHSKVVIEKDPLIEATRTKSLGLAHKQISKDAARCRQGLPDYIITMAKPGVNPEPVAKGRGFETYIGSNPEPRMKKSDIHGENKYSHHVWQRYANPIWRDINQTDTLNVKLARERNDERHICPLQKDVIARCVELWTNPGDIVASWFGGIGSEGYQAVKMGRKAVLCELKKSYFNVLVSNLIQAEKTKQMGLLRK